MTTDMAPLYRIELHPDPDMESPYKYVYSDETFLRAVELCETAGNIKETIICKCGTVIPYIDLHAYAAAAE